MLPAFLGLRAAKMDDNLFIERMSSVALLREDSHTSSLVLHVRRVIMVGNITQGAAAKQTGNL